MPSEHLRLTPHVAGCLNSSLEHRLALFLHGSYRPDSSDSKVPLFTNSRTRLRLTQRETGYLLNWIDTFQRAIQINLNKKLIGFR